MSMTKIGVWTLSTGPGIATFGGSSGMPSSSAVQPQPRSQKEEVVFVSAQHFQPGWLCEYRV